MISILQMSKLSLKDEITCSSLHRKWPEQSCSRDILNYFAVLSPLLAHVKALRECWFLSSSLLMVMLKWLWWWWTWFYYFQCLTLSSSRIPGKAFSHPLMREWETIKSCTSRPLGFGRKAHSCTQEFLYEECKVFWIPSVLFSPYVSELKSKITMAPCMCSHFKDATDRRTSMYRIISVLS